MTPTSRRKEKFQGEKGASLIPRSNSFWHFVKRDCVFVCSMEGLVTVFETHIRTGKQSISQSDKITRRQGFDQSHRLYCSPCIRVHRQALFAQSATVLSISRIPRPYI